MDVVAGIDIGGTNTVYGLVTAGGDIIGEGTITTGKSADPSSFIRDLCGRITEMEKSIPDLELKAVGIGAPNGNYHRGTIELAPNLAWKGIVPFAELTQKEINKPVVLTNDANAAALGEMMFGAAAGMKDFILLTLGTGLGSGIVVNGEVVYGHSGFAGEYGHVTMIKGGRLCGCGRKGCLETYASATGLVRTFIELLDNEKEISVLKDTEHNQISSRMIADAAAGGDPKALEAFRYTAEILAMAIANAIVVTSPQAVFLFGGLVKAGDLLFNPLRKYTERFILPVFRNTYEILPSGIPEKNAAVLGSAALAWKELA